jgi:hypothetical protein
MSVSHPILALPRRRAWLLVLGLAAWFGLGEIVTEAWYWSHEKSARRNPAWTFRWPDTAESGSKRVSNFQEFRVAGEEVLHFDRARGGTWIDSGLNRWIVTIIEWDPGKKVSAMDSRHNPIICLPSVGLQLVRELGETRVEIPGGHVAFHSFEFERGGRKSYVFSAVTRPLALQETVYRSGKMERRITQLEKAIYGNRQSPEREILIAIEGPSSAEEAAILLKQTFSQFVIPKTGK